MLQHWKAYVFHYGRSWNERKEAYVGLSQDDDSSTDAPRGAGEEKRNTHPAKVSIGARVLAAMTGVLFGTLIGAIVFTWRGCGENWYKASATHSTEGLLPASAYCLAQFSGRNSVDKLMHETPS